MADNKKYLSGTRYLIKQLLGTGASGNVYLAEDTTKEVGHNLCAIKELNPRAPDLLSQRELTERFFDEENFLRALDGFNNQIPKLYDCFSGMDHNGRETRYIVQEYIEGRMLRDLIKNDIVDEMRVKEILIKLLPVLAHIHSKGFVHRDIDPSNIILRSQNDLPVLIDFGAVKELTTTIVASSDHKSAYTLVIGKQGYMAPEHLLGQPVPASDLYSLGMTAIELLTGLKPSNIERDPKTGRLLWQAVAPNVSANFAVVLNKAIARDVKERYHGDARLMLFDIESLEIPEEELIKRQLGNAWTSLLKRQPKVSVKYWRCKGKNLYMSKSVKLDAGSKFPIVIERHTDSKPSGCEFYVSADDEYCSNCGAYNLRRLSNEDYTLLEETYGSPFAYKDKPTVRNYALWLACSGSLVGAIVGPLISNVLFEDLFHPALSILLGALPLFLIGFGIGYLIDVRQRRIREEQKLSERKLSERRYKRNQLRSKLVADTVKHLEVASCLSDVEEHIVNEVQDISRQEMRIQERIKFTRETEADIVEKHELQRQEEKLIQALERGKEKERKYLLKKQEITLVRDHNLFQAYRCSLSVNHESGAVIEEELKHLSVLIDGILESLKYGRVRDTKYALRSSSRYSEWPGKIVIDSDAGKSWLARILRAREILVQSRRLLLRYMNLLAVDERAASPEEFSRSLNLLDAYITYEDFYQEYQALRAE